MDERMAGLRQVESDSRCQDMADTGRRGRNAARHPMPANAPRFCCGAGVTVPQSMVQSEAPSPPSAGEAA
jgi:hypothetical protein